MKEEEADSIGKSCFRDERKFGAGLGGGGGGGGAWRGRVLGWKREGSSGWGVVKPKSRNHTFSRD